MVEERMEEERNASDREEARASKRKRKSRLLP
jgi:hypothetical protein